MRLAAEIEFRCTRHESVQADCQACAFVRHIENEASNLHVRHAQLMAKIKARAREQGDILLLDLR